LLEKVKFCEKFEMEVDAEEKREEKAEKGSAESDKEEEKPKKPKASFFRLFSHSSGFDKVILVTFSIRGIRF